MHLRCYFGWGGASPACNLLSALVDSVLAPAIEGVHVTYVDDLNGFGHPRTAPTDQAIAVGTIKAVLGPDAHAAEKARPTAPQGEVIGWCVDLPTQMLLPSAKGCRKLLWAFFTVDHRARTWPLLQCQLLSSLAHRYHVALRGMAPYVRPFDELLATSSQGARKVSAAARQSLLMWQAASVLLQVQPAAMRMPIDRFLRVPGSTAFTTLEAISDAGPQMLGVVLFDPATRRELINTGFRLPYAAAAEASDFQNVRELNGCTLAMLCARIFGTRCQAPADRAIAITWVGDNTTALSWVAKNRCRSGAAQRSFVAHNLITIIADVACDVTIHLAGLYMGDTDRLSRGGALQHLNPAHTVDTTSIPALRDLFGYLDPSQAPMRSEPQLQVLADIHRLVTAALCPISTLSSASQPGAHPL
jgi:hypothetical protein